MKFFVVSLLTISAAVLVIYSLANKVLGYHLKLKSLLCCAGCSLCITVIIPRVVPDFFSWGLTLGILAVCALLFAYVVAYYDNDEEEADSETADEQIMIPAVATTGPLALSVENMLPTGELLHDDNDCIAPITADEPHIAESPVVNLEQALMQVPADQEEPVPADDEASQVAEADTDRNEHIDIDIDSLIDSIIGEDEKPMARVEEESTRKTVEELPDTEAISVSTENNAEAVDNEANDDAFDVDSIFDQIMAASLGNDDTISSEDMSGNSLGDDKAVTEPVSTSHTSSEPGFDDVFTAVAYEEISDAKQHSVTDEIVLDAADRNEDTAEVGELSDKSGDEHVALPVTSLAEASDSNIIDKVELEPVVAETEAAALEIEPQLAIIPDVQEVGPDVDNKLPIDDDETVQASDIDETALLPDNNEHVEVKSISSLQEETAAKIAQLESLDELLDYAFACRDADDSFAAAAAFKKTWELYPDSDMVPMLIVELGSALKQAGNYDEAIEAFDHGQECCNGQAMQQQFSEAIAYLRIIKAVFADRNMQPMPFAAIPQEIRQQIDIQFQKWQEDK